MKFKSIFLIAGVALSASMSTVQASSDVTDVVLSDAQEAVSGGVPSSSTDLAKLIEKGKNTYSVCVGCHGVSGEGGIGPNLSSQTDSALIEKTFRYKAGETIGPLTPMMAPIAAGLSEEDVLSVAAYLDSLK